MWDYYPTDEQIAYRRERDGHTETAIVDVWVTDPRIQHLPAEGGRVVVVTVEVLDAILTELGYSRVDS